MRSSERQRTTKSSKCYSDINLVISDTEFFIYLHSFVIEHCNRFVVSQLNVFGIIQSIVFVMCSCNLLLTE